MSAATMPLGDRMLQTQYAGTLMSNWESLLQLLIALLFLLLAKYTFQIPYKLCGAGMAFSLQKAIMDDENHAVALSFSAFIFAVGIVCKICFETCARLIFAPLWLLMVPKVR